jgi:hypothetical protein
VTTNQNDDGTRGCLFVIGTTITSAAVGHLCGAPWGWLTAGLIVLAGVFLECLAIVFRKGS